MTGQGRYVLQDELGSGGMGAVFRAEDTATGRTVALKQLRSATAGRKRGMVEALFEREYHTLVRLKHPRIIEVYDYGFADDGPYYTMELLDGQDLQQLAPLPFREACRHLRDVASSLALIHAHRLVHRDISARNVRLTADGRAKLIDFGALTTFGIATDIVGTVPCMAPETLRHLPLDQRTDLFALGAIAYWALTGRHAYPARWAQELPSVWQRTPPFPSQLVAGIPHALDALVMSLLSSEPQARPASAAAVIDQLTAIAGLEPEQHEQAAESYLSSGRFVGRSEEQRWVQQRIERALQGSGAEVLVDGASGIGKTRLLHELCLAAQLKGAVVLRADAQAGNRAFGVATTLAIQLLDACPDIAKRTVGRDADLLAHLSPELALKLGVSTLPPLTEDPTERRARFQTALHEWFLAVAAEQTLLLAVDNAQAADDNSAAFVAALGREARTAHLVVLVTQRSGDAVVSPVSLRNVRKRSARLKLAGLGMAACEELVGSLFGNVPNTGRLAKLLYEKSGGNPQQCMALAQLLVKRKIAKYVDGTWVLPLDVAADELPSQIEEVLAEKLNALRPAARKLCETLSVHSQRVPIERCLALAEGMAEADTYVALDELVAEQILLVEEGCYGFSQQTLRESVLRQIDESRRNALHLRAADTLLANTEQSVGLRMEAAWHLLHAGEESRGADILAGTAGEFLKHQGVESVEQVVHALDTAVTLYEKQGRSKYEIAGPLFPLMSLSFFVDWRVTLKHGERAVELGLDITGLGLAQKLSRFMPPKLALGSGLAAAAASLATQRKRAVNYDLREAIASFCGLIPAAVGTQNIIFNLPAVKRFTEVLKPLKLFGKGHIASMMYDFAESQFLMSYGRETEACALLEQLRREFPDPAIKAMLGEAHWKAMYGGILFSLGIIYPYEFGGRALEVAHEMEELGVRVWAMAAQEVRMLHHASRGETEAVHRSRERVELFAVQGSSTWQAEIFWPILLLRSEISTGDAIAVRTIREQLMRRTKDHPTLEVYANMAHAAYLFLRGELTAAIAAYDEIFDQLRTLDQATGWGVFRACVSFADALNMAGEHARAKQFTSEMIARAGADMQRMVGHFLEPQRQLALAEAGLGNHAEAVRMLDALLDKHGSEDQPLLIGLLHKARADVALQMRDGTAFETHLAQMERRFSATQNPTLIAQTERLLANAIRSGLREGKASARPSTTIPAVASGAVVSGAISDLACASEPCEVALRLILRESRAKAGFLYVLHGDRMELVAASSPNEPPRQLEEQLLIDIRVSQRLDDADMTEAVDTPDSLPDPTKSVLIDSIPPPSVNIASGFRTLVLCTKRGGEAVVVGGVILELHPNQPFAIAAALLEPIGGVLLDRVATPTTARAFG